MDNQYKLLSVMMRSNPKIKPIKVGQTLYQTYCPFCNSDIPTLLIDTSLEEYHCFTCKRAGNLTNFLMENYKTDFFGAVKVLSGKEASSEKWRKQLDVYYQMNKDAAIYYHKNLYLKDTKGLKYWKENRGLSDEIIDKFGLGYAVSNGLNAFLLQKGYEKNLIKDNSLSRTGDHKEYSCHGGIDFFYNRVIIPIIDINKNVIGFGARVLDNSLPKYINSSQTPIYNKRMNLFALNLAQHSSRQGLILCEGYLDVITLHQYGYDNAVASLGTALTEEQVHLISKFTDTVYIAYDTDAAGTKATEEAVKLIHKQGLNAKRVIMPNAKDPDEFLKQYGTKGFDWCLSHSEYI